MRVFPNGFGFAILLGLAIGFASFNPALVQQWNLLGNGVLSQLIVILIFLLQGWKLDLKKLLKSLGNFDQTIRIQLGLLICPCFAVLVGDFFGWFEDDWFDAFLFWPSFQPQFPVRLFTLVMQGGTRILPLGNLQFQT